MNRVAVIFSSLLALVLSSCCKASPFCPLYLPSLLSHLSSSPSFLSDLFLELDELEEDELEDEDEEA